MVIMMFKCLVILGMLRLLFAFQPVGRPVNYLVYPASTQDNGIGDSFDRFSSGAAGISTNHGYPFQATNPSLATDIKPDLQPYWLQNWQTMEEKRKATESEFLRSLCFWHWFKMGYATPRGFCLMHWFK